MTARQAFRCVSLTCLLLFGGVAVGLFVYGSHDRPPVSASIGDWVTWSETTCVAYDYRLTSEVCENLRCYYALLQVSIAVDAPGSPYADYEIHEIPILMNHDPLVARLTVGNLYPIGDRFTCYYNHCRPANASLLYDHCTPEYAAYPSVSLPSALTDMALVVGAALVALPLLIHLVLGCILAVQPAGTSTGVLVDWVQLGRFLGASCTWRPARTGHPLSDIAMNRTARDLTAPVSANDPGSSGDEV